MSLTDRYHTSIDHSAGSFISSSKAQGNQHCGILILIVRFVRCVTLKMLNKAINNHYVSLNFGKIKPNSIFLYYA